MEITRAGSKASGKGPADWFTGTVRIDPLFTTPAPARVGGAAVTFEPGARTAWHTHPLGQTLIVTAGVGWAQREGSPVGKSAQAMWSGSHPEKSTGTAGRPRQPWPTSPFRRHSTARRSSGWSTSQMNSMALGRTRRHAANSNFRPKGAPECQFAGSGRSSQARCRQRAASRGGSIPAAPNQDRAARAGCVGGGEL